MRRLVRLLRDGRELRHVPVAVSPASVEAFRWTVESARERVPLAAVPVPILGLAPLTVRVPPAPTGEPCVLTLLPPWASRPVGRVRLGPSGPAPGEGSAHRPTAATNLVPPLPRRTVLTWLARRANARKARQGTSSLLMSTPDLIALDVLYMQPRPVYCVVVPHASEHNAFPMDLVSFDGGGASLTLALRRSSVSNPALKEGGPFALCRVPPEQKAVIYELAAAHRELGRFPDLPFGTEPSPTFGLPLPGWSTETWEGRVLGHDDRGSHTAFRAEVVSHRRADPAAATLAHVSGMFLDHSTELADRVRPV